MTNIKAHIHPAAIHRPRIHPVIPERASKVPEALEVAHFVACGLGVAPGAELGDEGAVSGAVQGYRKVAARGGKTWRCGVLCHGIGLSSIVLRREGLESLDGPVER